MNDLWTQEAEPGFPYWWREGQAGDTPDDRLPDRTDLLVIGAGYTGLSAAISAHDTGASVAVVDAGVPGHGASTRNGGMFGAHPRLGWEDLARSFGKNAADALFAEANPAAAFVRNLMNREEIACDYQQTGRIQLAWTERHFQSQRQLAAHVAAKSDVRVNVVERADLPDEIATDRYFGAITFPEHGAIHPRKFHEGLLGAVRSRNIPVVANNAVTALEQENQRWCATTRKGVITADKVVLATNGYTPGTFRWHQQRVFPLPSYLIATERLPSDQIRALAPAARMMVETRARHSYFRISPDGTRILFGGRASMRDIPLPRAARRLRATMLEVWPQLAGVKLSHVWTGYTGFSFNQMPNVGGQDGLFHAMGFSGSGTVMAPYLGAKAALMALGAKGAETAYSLTTLRRSWMHRFSQPYFLQPADIWYRQWVDRYEAHKRYIE